MDNKDLLNALGGAGEEFLKEAEPQERKAPARVRKLKPAVWASAAAVCLLAGIAAAGLLNGNRIGNRASQPADTAAPAETTAGEAAPSVETGPESAGTESRPDPDILYEKDGVTVRRSDGHVSPDVYSSPCLMYLTEAELFGKHLTMRAVLTDIETVEIINDRFEPPFDRTVASILTFEPVSVLRGDLPEGEPVRIYTDLGLNSSLESLNLSLRTAGKGREGLIMFYKMDDGYPEYMHALADYMTGDNQRFAIWEMPGGGLSYDKNAFPGLNKNWTLDQAEAYARSVIETDPRAPEDFWVRVRYQNWSEAAEDTREMYYDSRNGFYSDRGTPHLEEEYGAENLDTCIMPDPQLLGLLYRSCLRLKDMPEMLSAQDRAGERNTERIEIVWYADGEMHSVLYAGSVYTGHLRDVTLLEQTRTELFHYLGQTDAMRQWQDELETIASARRAERSREIKAALEAAFAEKYGPGGAPDWFRAAEISEAGGWLTIWLQPASPENIEEIRSLLPGFESEYSFGEGKGERESSGP